MGDALQKRLSALLPDNLAVSTTDTLGSAVHTAAPLTPPWNAVRQPTQRFLFGGGGGSNGEGLARVFHLLKTEIDEHRKATGKSDSKTLADVLKKQEEELGKIIKNTPDLLGPAATTLVDIGTLLLDVIEINVRIIKAEEKHDESKFANLHGRIASFVRVLLDALVVARHSDDAFLFIGLGLLEAYDVFSELVLDSLSSLFVKNFAKDDKVQRSYLIDLVAPRASKDPVSNPLMAPLIMQAVNVIKLGQGGDRSSSAPPTPSTAFQEKPKESRADHMLTLLRSLEQFDEDGFYVGMVEMIANADANLRRKAVQYLITTSVGSDHEKFVKKLSASPAGKYVLLPAVSRALASRDTDTYTFAISLLPLIKWANFPADHVKQVLAAALFLISKLTFRQRKATRSSSDDGSSIATTGTDKTGGKRKSVPPNKARQQFVTASMASMVTFNSEHVLKDASLDTEFILPVPLSEILHKWLKETLPSVSLLQRRGKPTSYESLVLEIFSAPAEDSVAINAWADRDESKRTGEQWSCLVAIRALSSLQYDECIPDLVFSKVAVQWLEFLGANMGVSTKRSLFSSAKDPATHHAVPRRSLLEKQYPTLATDEFAQILFDLFFTQEVDKPIWAMFKVLAASGKPAEYDKLILSTMVMCHFGITVPVNLWYNFITPALKSTLNLEIGARILEIFSWVTQWNIPLELSPSVLDEMLGFIHFAFQDQLRDNQNKALETDQELAAKHTVITVLLAAGYDVEYIHSRPLFPAFKSPYELIANVPVPTESASRTSSPIQPARSPKRESAKSMESISQLAQEEAVLTIPVVTYANGTPINDGNAIRASSTGNKALLQAKSKTRDILLAFLNSNNLAIKADVLFCIWSLLKKDGSMAKELYTLLMTSVWDVLALPNAWSQHVATNLFYDLIGPAKGDFIEHFVKTTWASKDILTRYQAADKVYGIISHLPFADVIDKVNLNEDASLETIVPLFDLLIGLATADDDAYVRSHAQDLLDSLNKTQLSRVTTLYQIALDPMIRQNPDQAKPIPESALKVLRSIFQLTNLFRGLQVFAWVDLFFYIQELARPVITSDIFPGSRSSSLSAPKQSMDQLGLNDAVGVGSLVNYLDGINADVAAECLGVMLAIALSMLNNGVAISDGDLLNLKGAILRIIGYKGSKCTVDGGWVHQGFQFFTENGQAVRYQGIWLDIVMPQLMLLLDRVEIKHTIPLDLASMVLKPDISGPTPTLPAMADRRGGLENDRAQTFVSLIINLVVAPERLKGDKHKYGLKTLTALGQTRLVPILQAFFVCIYKYNVDDVEINVWLRLLLDVFKTASVQNQKLIVQIFGAVLERYAAVSFGADGATRDANSQTKAVPKTVTALAGSTLVRNSSALITGVEKKVPKDIHVHMLFGMAQPILGTFGPLVTSINVQSKEAITIDIIQFFQRYFNRFTNHAGFYTQLFRFSVPNLGTKDSATLATLRRVKHFGNDPTRTALDMDAITRHVFCPAALFDARKDEGADDEEIKILQRLALAPIRDILMHLCENEKLKKEDPSLFFTVVVNLVHYAEHVYGGPMDDEIVTIAVKFVKDVVALAKSKGWSPSSYSVAPLIQLLCSVYKRKPSKVLLATVDETLKFAVVSGPLIDIDVVAAIQDAIYPGVTAKFDKEKDNSSSSSSSGAAANAGPNTAILSTPSTRGPNDSPTPGRHGLRRGNSQGILGRLALVVPAATIITPVAVPHAPTPVPSVVVSLFEMTQSAIHQSLKQLRNKSIEKIHIYPTHSTTFKLLGMDAYRADELHKVHLTEISFSAQQKYAGKGFYFANKYAQPHLIGFVEEIIEYIWQAEVTDKYKTPTSFDYVHAMEALKWSSVFVVDVWENELSERRVSLNGVLLSNKSAAAAADTTRQVRLMAWILYAAALRPQNIAVSLKLIESWKEIGQVFSLACQQKDQHRAIILIKSFVLLVRNLRLTPAGARLDLVDIETRVFTVGWSSFRVLFAFDKDDVSSDAKNGRETFKGVVTFFAQNKSPISVLYGAEFDYMVNVTSPDVNDSKKAAKYVSVPRQIEDAFVRALHASYDPTTAQKSVPATPNGPMGGSPALAPTPAAPNPASPVDTKSIRESYFGGGVPSPAIPTTPMALTMGR